MVDLNRPLLFALVVSGGACATAQWHEVQPCAAAYKPWLVISLLLTTFELLREDTPCTFRAPPGAPARLRRCLFVCGVFVALAPWLFVELPSKCRAPSAIRYWTYAWQAATSYFATGLLLGKQTGAASTHHSPPLRSGSDRAALAEPLRATSPARRTGTA